MNSKSASPHGPFWSRRAVLSVVGAGGAAGVAGGVSGCNGGGGSEGSQNKLKQKIDKPGKNFNRKGFPIVDKPITVEFMTGRPPTTASDYNKVASWKKYQEMSNIKVDWGLVPLESLEEKRNLALSSGDYPEVLYRQSLDAFNIAKYSSQGIFVDLSDLIDKYMPNLTKVLDDHPTVKKGMTFPDGAIYGFPTIYDPTFLALRFQFMLWVRGDWLQKFDMDVPQTTDEYYQYLKAVKIKRPNGKNPAVGYNERSELTYLWHSLMGSFAVGNRGPMAGNLDADPKDGDNVRFFPIVDEYKALLKYMHRLYREGLIAENVFSVDQAKLKSGLAKGHYGSIADIAPGRMFGGKAEQFVPVPALKGPAGHHSYNNVNSPLGSIGNFVITDKVKHPAAIARWMDYFYSDPGAKLFNMGVEGVSYKKTDDGVEYIDKITDNPKGLTQTEAKKPYVTQAGGNNPGIIKKEYFKGAESAPEQVTAAKLLKPDGQDEVWPAFTYTRDEAEKLDSLSDDIDKYVDESRDKFITGDKPFSDWKRYVDKIKQMGLDEYMEIQQAAFDRYRKG